MHAWADVKEMKSEGPFPTSTSPQPLGRGLVSYYIRRSWNQIPLSWDVQRSGHLGSGQRTREATNARKGMQRQSGWHH